VEALAPDSHGSVQALLILRAVRIHPRNPREERMAGKRLTLTSWFLLLLAAVFFALVGVLVQWGGHIEATLLVYGEPVFVTLDASRPRIVFLFTLPVALVATALAVRKQRKPR